MRGRSVCPVALFAGLALLCICITFYQVTISAFLFHDHGYSSFTRILSGTAYRPYIYRALLPQLALLIAYVTPLSVQAAVNDGIMTWLHSDSFRLMLQKRHGGINPDWNVVAEYIYPSAISIALMYAALLGYALTLRRLALEFFPGGGRIAWGTAFLGLLVLIPAIDPNAKMYDFPTLLLVALCLLAMQRRRWAGYLLFFALACINKETAFLQILLFAAAFFGRMERRAFNILLVAQCVLFAAITAIIHYVYAANPGMDVMYHPMDMLVTAAVDFKNVSHLLVLIALYGLVMLRWREIPFLLRQSLWLLPIMGGLYYVFGLQGEYRIFFDVFPYLTLIAGYALFRPLEEMKEELCTP